MRILVCGGRTWGEVPVDTPPDQLAAAREKAMRERWTVHASLDELTIDDGEMLPRAGTVIITGCAPGADRCADGWAVCNWTQLLEFPADWRTHGKAAGPIRNQRMLDEGKPDVVIAFPGGRGTADMVRRAERAGVRVVRVAP